MTAPILAAATFCITATVIHALSIAVAVVRFRRSALPAPPCGECPSVSIVRPLCGLDNYALETLRSTFELDYSHCEILARWQYLVDSLGWGFAQGKTMLWRRADLERAGGIGALAEEVAEDAAATKIVRSAGLKVRLIDRPLAQPLGRRSATEVWKRQLRWARLRRASFLIYFLPEIFSGGVLPMLGVAFLATAYGLPVVPNVVAFGALWYGGEMLLAVAAGWHVPVLYPLYGLARDLLLPVLFISAFSGNDFVWRGNEMQVQRIAPRRMMALVRPRVHEIAASGRRRLRSLRERVT
jgi:ceramide glucosyltransferase